MERIADDFADIARRARELASERSGGLASVKVRYGIWYNAPDRLPGWCNVDVFFGKWSICRDGDGVMPTLGDTESECQALIDSKQGGPWLREDMEVRIYSAEDL